MKRVAALLLGLALGGSAVAQQVNNSVLVTGTVTASGPFGYDESTRITCRGIPTCSGSFAQHVRQENCTNFYDATGTFVATGLDLTRSGALQGTVTTTFPAYVQQGGLCTPTSQLLSDSGIYTGTWDLAAARGSIRIVFGPNDVVTVNFTADVTSPPPVFPLAVRAQVGPQFSTVTADLNFRPQDVGRNGSVYVFAQAPAAIVRGASTPKDGPAPCTLAQLSNTGELVSVTLGQLRAFTTGAFAAAGTSVSILDGTPTPKVAGATFYVGYGSTGSQMLGDGIFRNAVIIPGSGACPPLPYQTALWWNPSESGWGLNLNQQGNLVFATLFTYDASRAPMWLVMSGGALQPDGLTFTGDLFRTTGSAFNANPFTPLGAANVSPVGTMSIEFTEANAGTLRYTVNGVEVTKPIQRQVYGSRSANCLPTSDARTAAVNYQDLWWNPAESGWGLNLTHQDETIFATLFTYAPGAGTGNTGLWLVMSGGAKQADGSYAGDLFRTAGSAFNAVPFVPLVGSDVTNVGTMRLRFSDGNNGTLTYTYLGTSVTKAITRQVFSTPVSACN